MYNPLQFNQRPISQLTKNDTIKDIVGIRVPLIKFLSDKGHVPLTPGLGIISITFTFVNQFGANLGLRI